jgi:hypothetical protein
MSDRKFGRGARAAASRRAAVSSVAPIFINIGALCVLAALGFRAPGIHENFRSII